MPRQRKPTSPFRYFNPSPEVIRLTVQSHVEDTIAGGPDKVIGVAEIARRQEHREMRDELVALSNCCSGAARIWRPV